MTEPAVLSIDLGTTAIKCAVYLRSGQLIAEAVREFELFTAAGGVVEMPVTEYWDALCAASMEVAELTRSASISAEVTGIAISAQGETIVPIGADGTPLRNAIVWLDNRATVEAQELTDRFSRGHIYEMTGQPEMLAAWPAAKILWVTRHEPAVAAKTFKWLLLEDFVLARMTGEFVCEYSLATSTCYWSIREKTWWNEMLAEIGVHVDQLPALVEPGTVIGPLRSAVAAELGLGRNVMVCAGALDQACGAIGGGGVAPDVLTETTGAAVALCAPLEGLRFDPQQMMPCHYHGIPDRYMFHTFTSGGIVMKWYRDVIAPGARGSGVKPHEYETLTQLAAQVPAGADGLVLLPHLQGAMAPDNNDAARGVFAGLTLDHGHGHMLRALMESIAFVVRRNLEALHDAGVAYESIRALGGGAKSRLWKQIEADVTHLPLITTAQPEAATLGAAIIGGVGLGWYSSVEEAAREQVIVAETFEPDPATKNQYDDAYGIWRDTYQALIPIFPRMSHA